jgi:hypothetical protein
MRTHHEDTAHEVYGEYRWRTFEPGDNAVTDGTAAEAAEAMELSVEVVEWAVEEYGRCNTGTIICWKPGEPELGTDGEPTGGGWEWPECEAPAEEE